jgi:hypothetical protein
MFPDALGGISYASEELADDEQTPAAAPVRRSKARTSDPAPITPEPALTPENPLQGHTEASDAETTPVDAEIVDAEVVEETVARKLPGESITGPQTKMLGSLMGTLGMDRDGALAFCADHIGRQIESRNDLTKAEATQIIDALVALQELQGGGDE